MATSIKMSGKFKGKDEDFLESILTRTDPETGLPLEESGLTDEELADRLEAYQSLSKPSGPVTSARIKNAVRKTVSELFDAYGVKSITGRNQLIDAVSSFATRARRMPTIRELIEQELTPREFGKAELQTALGHAPFTNFLNDQDAANRISSLVQPQDYRLDIRRITDILESRGAEKAKTAEAEKFLAEAPAELRASREKFLSTQQDLAQRYLEGRIAPRVLAELNVRGLAQGPDVGSVLAAEGASLQASIEDQLRQQEAQDAAFFADSAFRIETAKLEMSEESFRKNLAVERGRLRQEQETRFKTREQGIQSDFELGLLRREQERNLRLREAGFDVSASDAAARRRTENLSDIGESAGEIIATKVGTKTSTKNAPSTSTPSFAPQFESIG